VIQPSFTGKTSILRIAAVTYIKGSHLMTLHVQYHVMPCSEYSKGFRYRGRSI